MAIKTGLLVCLLSMAPVLGVGLRASPPQDDSWLKPGKVEGACTELNANDVHEVVASRTSNARYDLRKDEFIEIDEDRAEWYVSHDFDPGDGKSLYLVRALYLSGAGARFSVHLCDGALVVRHTSLGASGAAKTALVVRIEHKPTSVLVLVSSPQ